jgi:hypothetical protein
MNDRNGRGLLPYSVAVVTTWLRQLPTFITRELLSISCPRLRCLKTIKSFPREAKCARRERWVHL